MSRSTVLGNAFADLVNGMAEQRRQYASDNGFVATDEEIADSIKASLVRMMEDSK